MQSAYLKFFNRLFIFAVLFALLSWLIISNLKPEWQSPVWPFIIVFFFAITLILHRILLRSSGERFARFANQFMLITFVKMIFYVAVMLIYVFLVNPDDAIPFVVTFFVCYLAFTSFEVVEILRVRQAGREGGTIDD